jgi:hypothetical protein
MSLLKKMTNVAIDKMKSKTKDALQVSKDATNSTLFKGAMNPFIKSYGQIISFKIDSKDKAMHIEIMLKGEVKPYRVDIPKYKFINEGDKFYVEIIRMNANRYWMDAIMETFLVGQRFELPGEFNKPIQAIM